ncbi:MAG: Laminin sub protein [Candidatus Saccharibacteria bacterium]|nr:Laminin sub protein [Candidatus Saccharibacteria bacterium]
MSREDCSILSLSRSEVATTGRLWFTMSRMQWAKQTAKSGFTIVELLIVIVVIGILAAITIVAYNGVQDRAKASSLQGDLNLSVKKLEIYKVQNTSGDFYPLTLALADFNSVNGNTVTYYPNDPASPSAFCIEAKKDTQSWYITSFNKSPQNGNCQITSGMAGWWKLNGNTQDTSVNARHGTAVNATATTGQNNQASSAYTFNGTSAYISLPASPTIEKSSVTVTAWFKTSNGADKKIFATTTNTHLLQLFNSGTAGVMRVCLTAPFAGCTVGSTSRSDGKWHFAASVGDLTGVRIYVDGNVTADVTSLTSGAGTQGTSGRIGADFTPNFFFQGDIDDVRLYDRSLSMDEIQTIYAAGAQ